MEFKDLTKVRRSATNFDINHEISEAELKEIINLTKLAPSAFNLQSTEYLAVTTSELKEFLYVMNFEQYKIRSASAVMLVLGNPNKITQESAEALYHPMFKLGMMEAPAYKSLIQDIGNFCGYIHSDAASLSKELMLSASISSAFFILAAKEQGYDTCPMHIANVDKVKTIFNIPKEVEVIMMITIGKAIGSKTIRSSRRATNDILRINSYRT